LENAFEAIVRKDLVCEKDEEEKKKRKKEEGSKKVYLAEQMSNRSSTF
jgi:hypothetical protein